MSPSSNPLSNDAVRERLREYPVWRLAADGRLEADLTFKNFSRAVLFANAIAHLAETHDHHPDLLLHDYKHLTIRLMTHSAGGITERDFALLAAIDALPRPD